MGDKLPQIASLEEEEEAISVLKARLQAEGVRLPEDMVFAGDIDATLLRFIRARKLNIDDTLKMITDCIKWRHEADVRRLLISPMEHNKMEVIRMHRPSSYVGFDKQGRPVFVDRPGIINYDKIWEAGCTDDDILRFHISEMEYMGRILLSEASKLKGHTVDSVTVIMDMSGLSMRHFTKQSRELFKQILKTDSDNYPETNAGTYIVNVSWVFQTIWKFVSSIIDARTAAKIQVLGSGSAALPILQQVMDMSVIPDFLGGENKYDACRASWAKRMDREISSFASAQHSDSGQVIFSEPPVTPKANISVKQSPLASLRRSLSRGKRTPGRSKSERHIRSGSQAETKTNSDSGAAPPQPLLDSKRMRRTWFGPRRSSKSSLESGDPGDPKPDSQTWTKEQASTSKTVPNVDHRSHTQHPPPARASAHVSDSPPRTRIRIPLAMHVDDIDAASSSESDQMDPNIGNAISRIDALISKVKQLRGRSTDNGALPTTGKFLTTPHAAAASQEDAAIAGTTAVAGHSTSENSETPQCALHGSDIQDTVGDADKLCYRMELSGSAGAVSSVLRGHPRDTVLHGTGKDSGSDTALEGDTLRSPKCGCAIQ